MRIIKRTTVFAAFVALGSVCMMAAESGVTFLFNDGTTASFAFSSRPKIVVSQDGLIVSAHGRGDASYQFADVRRYYFVSDIDAGIDSVRGGGASSAVCRPVFRYAFGIVAVSGMRRGESLRAYSVGGAAVGAAVADADGNASIDLSGAAHGIYVISTGSGVSFKVINN